MGQQQLLLLVLGIVIVGLAVVVGIQAFGENQKKANADALVADAVRIASDTQAWKLKPAAFGGGANNDPNDFQSVSFARLGYEADATTNRYTNLNGEFSVTGGEDNVIIVGCNAAQGNQVTVTVTGTATTDITTATANVTSCF